MPQIVPKTEGISFLTPVFDTSGELFGQVQNQRACFKGKRDCCYLPGVGLR